MIFLSIERDYLANIFCQKFFLG